MEKYKSPRLIAWEITRNCNLNCVHCRAAAGKGPYSGELDTEKCYALLDTIAEIGSPIVILTGGEPLLRPDIFDIAAYGTKKELKMVMAPNGTLITETVAKKMAESGIKRISISIDGADKESHDKFRGVDRAFDRALNGIKATKNASIEFQINTTITKKNIDQLPAILKLAEKLGAVALHIFLLVPTGRGKYIADSGIGANEYETTLKWLYKQKTNLQLKATCAPHYYRIIRQMAKAQGKQISFKTHGMEAVTKGCLAGTGFCFISHTGRVQPCGFLDLDCGNITKTPFADIWKDSEIFKILRDPANLKGKCKICEYKKVCSGCRARAYEASGDFMAEEPLCSYKPANAGYST